MQLRRARQMPQEVKQERKEDCDGGELGRVGGRPGILGDVLQAHAHHSAPRPLWHWKPRGAGLGLM